MHFIVFVTAQRIRLQSIHRRAEYLHMNLPRAPYHVYLLRLWQEQRREKPIWRASLEDTQGGEQHGFVNLRDLFLFLAEQAGDNEILQEVTPEDTKLGKNREEAEDE